MKRKTIVIPLLIATLMSCNTNETKEEITGKEITSSDTLESESEVEFSIDIPKSNIELLDKIINDEISIIKEEFEKTQESGILKVKTVSEYKDNNIISYLLEIDRNGSEMPHSNIEYKSYNFDYEKNDLITFGEYFHLKNEADSLLLIKRIRENSNINDDMLLTGEKSLLENAVFNIKENSVIINYGHYTIASYDAGTINVELKK
jgi:hypothetical protein